MLKDHVSDEALKKVLWVMEDVVAFCAVLALSALPIVIWLVASGGR